MMKKIYIILVLSISFFQALGQVAIGPEGGVVPLGAYPAYYNQYLKGGFKSGPDIASRDAYPMNLRDTESFIFYTRSDATFWVLKGGLTNSNWVKLDIGGTPSKSSSGAAFPTSPAEGDTFYLTTDKRLYLYNGATWIATDNSLAPGQLYLGDASGIAVATEKSAISISGFDKAVADVSMGNGTSNFKIVNLADPVAAQDAATKNYVDLKSANTPSGTSLPTGANAGDTFYHTTENRLYVFNGYTWVPLDNSLLSGELYVGNASGIAVSTSKNTIPISGFDKAADDVLMGDGTNNFKIANLADPTTDQDAATKKYVDSKSTKTPAGASLPGAANAGDTFYHTTENRLYVYNSTAWVPTDNILATGQFYVGNASGIAAAVEKNTIPISGFDKATSNILMGDGIVNYKITNLAQPEADQDAATKNYVDASATAAKDNFGNHTAAQNLKLGSFSISNDGEANKGLTFDATGNAYFGQDVTVNNNVLTPSDRRLKTKVETLGDVLSAIDQMRGVRFEYIDQHKYAKGPKIGVIAQELQEVYPELVVKGKDGFFKVDYTQLTGILIQAIKEQQLQIKEQQKEINKLKDQGLKLQEQIDVIFQSLKK